MRLLTRPDLDGLTCGVLLSVVENIHEVIFVEPHAMQTGEVQVCGDDIIANLPFHPACGMWFDHHASNAPAPGLKFRGAFNVDPSAARTIFEFYRDARLNRYAELLIGTDKVDSADLSLQDVLKPEGYVLLSLTLDPRTNLDDGDSDAYYHQLLEWLKTDDIETLLERPEVRRRTELILAEQERFERAILEHSRVVKNVVVTDFRGVKPQPVGGRFVVYALFPQCNTSLKLYPARRHATNVGISVGHSIFSRTQSVSSGQLCARYGGGGHFGAASCVVAPGDADRIRDEMLEVLTEDVRHKP